MSKNNDKNEFANSELAETLYSLMTKEQLIIALKSSVSRSLELENGISEFLKNNFQGGPKCDREDYTQMVSCKDIYDLKNTLEKTSKKE